MSSVSATHQTAHAAREKAPVDREGLLIGLGAYLAWVVFPIYFKSLAHIDSLQILFHRVVWSLLFMVIVMTWQRRWPRLLLALRNRRVLLTYATAAVLLAANWYIYIWAVTNGHILEGSLGYFINPLVNVLLGVLFLRERMRTGQWAAIGVAAAGVGYLTWNYGQLPWIALSLAFSFGLYGLVKKKATLPAEEGMTLETATLFLPALAGLLWFEARGTGGFAVGGTGSDLLLLLSGPITAVPLLLFATAAQRIPLSTLGVLQYVAPTGQFLVAVLLYGEAFPQYKLIGFAIIWLALALYWIENWLVWRGRPIAASVLKNNLQGS